MPVAVVSDYRDAELEQYDKVLDRLGYEPAGSGPEGLLFHWATKTPEGVRTVEVWQDRAAADAHAEGRVVPAAREAGIEGDPRVAYIDVHNYLIRA